MLQLPFSLTQSEHRSFRHCRDPTETPQILFPLVLKLFAYVYASFIFSHNSKCDFHELLPSFVQQPKESPVSRIVHIFAAWDIHSSFQNIIAPSLSNTF